MLRILYQMPNAIQRLYGGVVWRLPNKEDGEKTIYLTFDDGPVPEVTPPVLDILDRYAVKATFFMVGENILKHPELAREVLRRGHSVGNHTFNHLKGTAKGVKEYIDNVEQTDALLDNIHPMGHSRQRLLRPPYGKMKFAQKRLLAQTHRLILWDVITHDYNKDYSPEKVLQVVKRYSRDGSIVVFHDSIKASRNVLAVLPKAIEYWLEQGYRLQVI